MTGALETGKVAVVTGASSGIGEATARLLARSGWQCVLIARREDALRQLATEIGGEIVVCDVSDRDAVAATTAGILGRHPLDRPPRLRVQASSFGAPSSRLLSTRSNERSPSTTSAGSG